MRYKLFGKTGLKVSELCLGTMTFGDEWGFGAKLEESRAMYTAFVDKGGNFFDTADFYTQGTSEKMLGEFVKGRRNESVLATKYSLNTNPRDPNAGGNSRKNMMQSVEGSLARLGTDYIDILWLHAWDFMTPVEEIMRGLDDLVRAGKVLYIGISDTPAFLVAKSNTLAELRGWTSFAGLQLPYNLTERSIEREYTLLAKEYDMTIVAWSPLAGGILTGKYNPEVDPAEKEGARYQDSSYAKRHMTERNFNIANTVRKIAQEIEKTPAQVAVAWVKGQGKNIIPILGARRKSQLDGLLELSEVKLDAGHLEELHAVSKIKMDFPYDFLAQDSIMKAVYGSTLAKMDWRR